MNQSPRLFCSAQRGALLLALLCAIAPDSHAAPSGAAVAAGAASIATNGAKTTITQSSANAAINWQRFGISAGETVQFAQPSSSSVTLNRVLGPDPSAIFGTLSANGNVFLLNPNGVLFAHGSAVNVGGLLASTLALSDTHFMAGQYTLTNAGAGAVVNQGTINADGGYVALLGRNVRNEGVISARLGTVALAAGNAMTMDVMGGRLVNVRVDEGAVNALVNNGGILRSDGGLVLLSTQAAGNLLSTAVNNTGIIQARTVGSHAGKIMLLGDMQSGTVTVSGTLDASAPSAGNGGFVETSAARINVQDQAHVTTAAPSGRIGTWLIDPQDFTVGGGASDNISGATLSALLVTNSVTISTNTGPDVVTAGAPPVTSLNTAKIGNGDIFVNQAVSWTASSNATTLTLNAARDVNLNQPVTAVNGNLVVCCGRDIAVNAAITTTNGSVLLSAGRTLTVNAVAAMTTTDGNITMCAANDVNVAAQITLTRGSSIPSQSLALPLGLALSAGTGGTGPGIGGGTVVFAPLTPPAAVTGPNAPVTINYNPVSYLVPTSYAGNFTLTGGSTLSQHMLVFATGGDRVANGSTATTLTSLKSAPAGVSLVAGAGSVANFDTAAAGAGKTISFSGYSLTGANAADFALPVSCCVPVVAHTTGNILVAQGIFPPTPLVPGASPGPVPALGPGGVPGFIQGPGAVAGFAPGPGVAFVPVPIPQQQFITVAMGLAVLPPPATLVAVESDVLPQLSLVVSAPAVAPLPAVMAAPNVVVVAPAPAAPVAPIAAPLPAPTPRAPAVRPPRAFRN